MNFLFFAQSSVTLQSFTISRFGTICHVERFLLWQFDESVLFQSKNHKLR